MRSPIPLTEDYAEQLLYRNTLYHVRFSRGYLESKWRAMEHDMAHFLTTLAPGRFAVFGRPLETRIYLIHSPAEGLPDVKSINANSLPISRSTIPRILRLLRIGVSRTSDSADPFTLVLPGAELTFSRPERSGLISVLEALAAYRRPYPFCRAV